MGFLILTPLTARAGGYECVATGNDLKTVRANARGLAPGNYIIVREMQEFTVEEPKPEPVSNKVSFGPSTLSRGPRKPKGDSKQLPLPGVTTQS